MTHWNWSAGGELHLISEHIYIRRGVNAFSISLDRWILNSPSWLPALYVHVSMSHTFSDVISSSSVERTEGQWKKIVSDVIQNQWENLMFVIIAKVNMWRVVKTSGWSHCGGVGWRVTRRGLTDHCQHYPSALQPALSLSLSLSLSLTRMAEFRPTVARRWERHSWSRVLPGGTGLSGLRGSTNTSTSPNVRADTFNKPDFRRIKS